MKNFNLKKIVSKNKSGGFALLETLLMLGILVVVTVLTVYTVYAKTSEARHVQINSNELASIHAATANHIALHPSEDIVLGRLGAHGAHGGIYTNMTTSDGFSVTHGPAAPDQLVLNIEKAGPSAHWELISSNMTKLHPGASCVPDPQNEDIQCIFSLAK